jgi:regulator of protease activity HflC (stomatin/prohibitin superfamily)
MPDPYDLNKPPSLSSDLRKLKGSSYGRRALNLRELGPKRVALFILLFLVIIFIFLDSLYTIEQGFVGIKLRSGRYMMDEVMPGLHFRIPFAEKVETVDVRSRAIKYLNPERISSNQELSEVSRVLYRGPIRGLDKNGREIDTELFITYQLKPKMAAEVVAQYADSWDTELIHPALIGAVKDCIADFRAEELAMRRSLVYQLISDSVFEAISEIEGEPFLISSIELEDLTVVTQMAEASPDVPEMKAEAEAEISDAEIAEVEIAEVDQLPEPQVEQGTEESDFPEELGQPDPMSPPTQVVTQQDAGGLDVEMYFCEAIKKSIDENNALSWDLLGRADEFAPDVGRVICYTRIRGASANTVIKHRWFWENKLQGEVQLEVKSADYRTYSRKTVFSHQTGIWRVEVVVADDHATLASRSFVIQ